MLQKKNKYSVSLFFSVFLVNAAIIRGELRQLPFASASLEEKWFLKILIYKVEDSFPSLGTAVVAYSFSLSKHMFFDGNQSKSDWFL